MAKLEDLIMQGTRSAQPEAGVAGRLYCVTDEDNLVERDNGTSWEEYSTSGSSIDILQIQVFS